MADKRTTTLKLTITTEAYYASAERWDWDSLLDLEEGDEVIVEVIPDKADDVTA